MAIKELLQGALGAIKKQYVALRYDPTEYALGIVKDFNDGLVSIAQGLEEFSDDVRNVAKELEAADGFYRLPSIKPLVTGIEDIVQPICYTN